MYGKDQVTFQNRWVGKSRWTTRRHLQVGALWGHISLKVRTLEAEDPDSKAKKAPAIHFFLPPCQYCSLPLHPSLQFPWVQEGDSECLDKGQKLHISMGHTPHVDGSQWIVYFDRSLCLCDHSNRYGFHEEAIRLAHLNGSNCFYVISYTSAFYLPQDLHW